MSDFMEGFENGFRRGFRRCYADGTIADIADCAFRTLAVFGGMSLGLGCYKTGAASLGVAALLGVYSVIIEPKGVGIR